MCTKGLTPEGLERYRRQMLLQGFTPEVQLRLRGSTALVAGVGGVGGTAAIYLAVAGTGRLVLVHYGNLTLSNMNRQILMSHGWIGKSRVEQARRRIEEVNPEVEVITFKERITPQNAGQMLKGVDIALSARPNFHERRALNGECVRIGIPMIEAAMNGMEGYLFNVVPGVTPCLNCVYPDDDPGWEELGFPVLGAVSGLLGCMMAIEAIKLITGYGSSLGQEMIIFSTTDMSFRKVRIYRDPHCPICSKI